MSRGRNTKAQDYITQHFVQESPLHLKIAERLKADSKFGINVAPYEGRLLQFLMQMNGCKKVLEIGTLYGYSTLWMAEALPADGKLVTIEYNPEHFAAAESLLSQSDTWKKIKMLQGPALEKLTEVDFQPDFIFIDADKPNYANYLNWAMEHVAQGGLIVGDNTFLFGHLIGEDRGEGPSGSPAAIKAMSTFNETLAKAKGFRSIMIPTWEGLTIAQKI